MAQLPPDGEWLIQQINGEMVLYHHYTEEEIARWSPVDINEIRPALKTITESDRLNEEQKSLAAFWAGYFYGYACSRE